MGGLSTQKLVNILFYSLFGPFLFFYYHFNTFRGEKDKEGKHVFLSINQFVVYSPNLGTLVGTPKRVVSTIVSIFLFDDFRTVEHIPTKYNFLYNVINAERKIRTSFRDFSHSQWSWEV